MFITVPENRNQDQQVLVTRVQHARMIPSFERCYPHDARSGKNVRRDVATFAAQLGFGAHQLHEIMVAVGEAVNNAIEHSDSSAAFSISCESHNGRLAIFVKDNGHSFDPTRIGVTGEFRGRGTVLMRHLMDLVEFSNDGNGTVVRLEKYKTQIKSRDKIRSS